MGKYMKKSKITAEVSLLGMSSHSSMAFSGVRTRAKTLALRRLHNSFASPSSASSSCYLELRSRKLHKPMQLPIKPRNQPPRRKQGSGENPNFVSSPVAEREASSRLVAGSVSVAPVSMSGEETQSSSEEHFRDGTERAALEDSYGGENTSEPDEHRKRRVSLFTARRLIQGNFVLPTENEMEDFFAFAEQEQQRLFIEKYNFDVITDAPLPGRFKWVRADP